MAENDMCIARHTFAGDGPESTFVDHHEWRFLGTKKKVVGTGAGSRVNLYDVFYCVFCLESKQILQVKGQWDSN